MDKRSPRQIFKKLYLCEDKLFKGIGNQQQAVDKILKTLPLLEKNSSFSDWAAERIDTAFDIYEEYPALLM